MGIYAAAVREILGQIPKTALLYFLKNSWTSTISLTPEFLDSCVKRIRQMQEEMLAVSL